VALGDIVRLTDAEGRFTFENVEAPYDLAFKTPGKRWSTDKPSLWIYRGLTRSDPTLQLEATYGEHGASVGLNFLGQSQEGPDAPFVCVAGVFDGGNFASIRNPPGPHVGVHAMQVDWWGPRQVTGTLHALAWRSQDVTFLGNDVAPDYTSYRERTVALYPRDAIDTGFDISPTVVPTAPYIAHVENAPGGESLRLAFGLSFSDGAIVSIGDVALFDADAPITVRMPVLPDAHPRFSLSASGPYHGPVTTLAEPPDTRFVTSWFATACGPAESEGQTALQVPVPIRLASPGNKAEAIDENTVFEWSESSEVSIFSVSCTNIRLYSVGVAHSGHVPVSKALAVLFPLSDECSWSVEVRGSRATIDEAAGPGGMFDHCHTSPVADTGKMTVSEGHWFKTRE